ncbi:helix-turn-helix domain-containing protein [Nocardiopsis alba]|uniref:helix-turn-helix domain-containing protein n=1 Tax=Nocardiopsis alba TaxID=53437 RepID=UPI003D73B038
MKVPRAARAQLVRDAARIRADQQRRGATVPAITAQIVRDLPISPLEAWRLAYGWSRPHVVEAVADLYLSDGLAPPGLTTAMLCRWEHGHARPGFDYIHALARVYGVPPGRLGVPLPHRGLGWYGPLIPQPRQEPHMPPEYPELTAVADSISLHGADTTEELAEAALEFYTRRYSDFPPSVLAEEVARCRSLLITKTDGSDLHRVLGWMSALLGNLAHHTDDPAGALIHLSTAARLGTQVGDPTLVGWSLGAQSMVTTARERDAEALELADRALEFANDPLRRAQIIAWCRLRPLAGLDDHERLGTAVTEARRYMDLADREEPGRFGFDRAEFHHHLSEALLTTDTTAARAHAETSIALKRTGSPGWAAATTTHARALAASRDVDGAVALGMSVLEAVPEGSLRANTRQRMLRLVTEVGDGGAARGLAEAVRSRRA